MIKKELAVVARKYMDKNGQEKSVWKSIGAIHEHNGKEYMTLDPMVNLAAIPRREGDDRVFVSMFEPKPKESRPKQSGGDFDDLPDDIPF